MARAIVQYNNMGTYTMPVQLMWKIYWFVEILCTLYTTSDDYQVLIFLLNKIKYQRCFVKVQKKMREYFWKVLKRCNFIIIINPLKNILWCHATVNTSKQLDVYELEEDERRQYIFPSINTFPENKCVDVV